MSTLSTLAGEPPIEIDWDDLIPGSDGGTMDQVRTRGVIQHGQLDTPFEQDTGGEISTKYSGKRVRIAGYLVPLDLEGRAVRQALLVPYVGACIHIPPPPPNQLILITSELSYESRSLFEPVWVAGEFDAVATNTRFAQSGYSLTAEEITPYS